MGQVSPFHSAEDFIVDIVETGGPEMLAQVAIKCVALAITTKALEINTLIQFAVLCSRHDEELAVHFLDMVERCGNLRAPLA